MQTKINNFSNWENWLGYVSYRFFETFLKRLIYVDDVQYSKKNQQEYKTDQISSVQEWEEIKQSQLLIQFFS